MVVVLVVGSAVGRAAPEKLCEGAAMAVTPPANPPELGIISWRRGYAGAKEEARQTGKPLLVLFNEVPGCSTVNAFGRGVLSDVVVADAVEGFFVPVFVANNEEGDDRAVLRHFGEPTWNNPVIRIIDVDENALVPRLEGADPRVHLLGRIVLALHATKRTVPAWLGAAAADVEPVAGSRVYAMGCFWAGEVALGALPGVLSTSPGFSGGREVVKVSFGKGTNVAGLDAAVAAFGFDPVAGNDFVFASGDDKYQLRGNKLFAGLSPGQRMRMNSAAGRGEDPLAWLSPRQRAAHQQSQCRR